MELMINGSKTEVTVTPDTDLLSVLREELDLTGSKYGCGEGVCGACMVLVDDIPMTACVLPLSALAGKSIVTIEGLEKDGKLHAVQEAFLKVDPFQCSYCASGMIVSSAALLSRNDAPSNEEIIEAMNRNICRCGTYANIMKAIQLSSSV